MKKIYHYSEKKFNSFSEHKQNAIILEMLEVLETNWENREYAKLLRASLKECLTFLENRNNPLSNENIDFAELASIIAFRDTLLNTTGASLKDNDILIKRYDSVNNKSCKFPLVIILDNLRSAFNVGSIIRSSECLGVLEIALCGKTPGPENRKVTETSMGTTDYVDLFKFASTEEAILSYSQQGFEIIALELTNNSLPIEKYNPGAKVALLLGNESLGVAEETLAMCDKIIQIEMYGRKNSLNVSSTAAIAIHNIREKMEKIK